MFRPRCTLTLVLLLSVAGFAPAANKADQFFAELSKDFGSVPRGPALQHAFAFRNNSADVVRISTLRVSCGCVVATAPQNVLQPGEESVIQVKMDTTRFRGMKSVTVFVHFDKPKNDEVRLWLRADARDDVNLSPDNINFGQIKRGESPTATVRVTFQGNGGVRIAEVQTESNYVLATIHELHRKPNEVAYELTARMRSDAPVGRWFTDIWLKTDQPQLPRVRVPLNVEVESPLSVSPAILAFGDVPLGKEIERRIIVRGVKPFRVLAIKGADTVLNVKEAGDTSKTIHVMTVTVKPDTVGDTTRRLEIQTDLEGAATIDFQATVKAIVLP